MTASARVSAGPRSTAISEKERASSNPLPQWGLWRDRAALQPPRSPRWPQEVGTSRQLMVTSPSIPSAGSALPKRWPGRGPVGSPTSPARWGHPAPHKQPVRGEALRREQSGRATPPARGTPAGQRCPRNGGGSEGGVEAAAGHTRPNRGACPPRSLPAAPSTPTNRVGSTPPAQPCLKSLSATPGARLKRRGHRKEPDSWLACLFLLSLLNDFEDVITVESDALERRGASEA